ncbi:tyrosine-type recombinase/integrase [Kineosporia sp. J2-2]|uniref:Tyrosine-type recombinase/integrase n=1 Tax=Kineosporia corallincola TaxID=2835133 RepID=A0ABS5TDC3_9ACTN|nr:tyrosine-type recombinase/integrase [Kineosporia corallincola]MBT0769085.1 tyrosine-type recombinase/integrase [Kineosporia corallincola]
MITLRSGYPGADFGSWLAHTQGFSRHTVRAYTSDAARFQEFIGLTPGSAAVTGDQIRRFLESRRREGLSEATIRRNLAAARSFCRWLQASELPVDRDWSQVRFRTSGARPLPRSIPRHELSQLLRCLLRSADLGAPPAPLTRPHKVTTLVAVTLMITTGVRVGEVVQIRTGDITFADESIRIHGKGSRERVVYYTGSWLNPLLRAYLDARADLGVGHPYLLFKNDLDPMTTSALRDRIAGAGRASRIGRHLTPHMFRHSAATQLLESGIDIRYVQRLLGHASISTTEIYTHVSDVALRRVITQADVLRHCLDP